MDTHADTLFTLAAVTCWFCIPIAIPRVWQGAGGEAVYLRVLGQRRALVTLALSLTVLAALIHVLAVPTRTDPDLQAVRLAHAQCATVLSDISSPSICYELDSGGVWVVEQWDDNHQWVIIETLARRPWFGETPRCEPPCITQ